MRSAICSPIPDLLSSSMASPRLRWRPVHIGYRAPASDHKHLPRPPDLPVRDRLSVCATDRPYSVYQHNIPVQRATSLSICGNPPFKPNVEPNLDATQAGRGPRRRRSWDRRALRVSVTTLNPSRFDVFSAKESCQSCQRAIDWNTPSRSAPNLGFSAHREMPYGLRSLQEIHVNRFRPQGASAAIQAPEASSGIALGVAGYRAAST